MIFSHAPAGFIITYFSIKNKKNKLTKKQTFWLFVIGIIGGIFPDIDLFYHYFVTTSEVHRALITHTPILYLSVFITVFLIGYFKKSYFIKLASYIILLSTFSHLILDSIGSGIAWLYPFSGLPYGFLSWSWMGEGLFGQNYFFVNYSLEIIILTLFFNILILALKEKINKYLLTSSLVLALIIISILFYLNLHLFSINSDIYYDDIDKDGIMNMKDLDMDGDGILNIDDADANNNGRNNREDLIIAAGSMEGVFADKTEEEFFGLFSRFGFLSNIDIIRKPNDYVGIFLGKEVNEDYQTNPEGYVEEPEKDYLFNERLVNLHNLCSHKNLLISSNSSLEIGDIIFYENNDQISHASIFIEKPNLVLYFNNEDEVAKVNINDVKSKYSGSIYICRFLK